MTREGNGAVSVGYGIGLIAATVATVANNIDAIVELGLEGVRVAFRLAISLQQMGKNIEDPNGIWNLVVAGISFEELDQRLAKINGMVQPLHHAYIGQILPKSLVVFGPPST